MKKVAIIAGLASLLLFSSTAMADETKKDEHSGHGTTQVQPAAKQEPTKTTAPTQAPVSKDSHETHNMTLEEHQTMSTTTNTSNTTTPVTDAHSTTTTDGHASHDSTATADSHKESEGSSGGHGGHENVVETPPNIPVLATFGAINAAFILFGIWSKWFRKKEVLA